MVSDKELLKPLQELGSIYKIDIKNKNIDELISMILQIREEARKNKDWNTADNIRNKLEDIGFEIQDSVNGPVWRKKIL
jgi:cysteinyl-tRNA synthetase